MGPVIFLGTFDTLTASYIYSRDGVTWSVGAFPPANNYAGMAYGGSSPLWVVMTRSQDIVTSPDGITWTQHAGVMPAAGAWTDVAWSPTLGLFAAIETTGSGHQVATSPDGLTWTLRTTPAGAFTLPTIIWSARLGLFIVGIAGGLSTNAVFTSPDGITWTLRTTAGTANSGTMRDFGAGFDVFGLIIGSTTYESSPDGIAWTAQVTGTLPSSGNTNGACYRLGSAPEAFCLTGNNVLAKTTAVDFATAGWSLVTASPAVPGFTGISYCVAYSEALGMAAISGGGLGNTQIVTALPGPTLALYNPTNAVGGRLVYFKAAAPLFPVPNVVGEPLATGEADIIAAGLTVGTVTDASSGIVPVGDIISTNPVAGTMVAFGSAVDIVKSIGPPNTVPDVIGFVLAAGEADIVAAGLTVGVVTSAFSGSVPIGDIITISPIAGSIVSPGSPVDIVESAGPGIVVPDLSGLTQADASSAITAATLVLGPVTSAFSNTVPAGLVFAQSPVAGARVAPGSAVGFTVSLGPQTVAVPDVVGLTAAAAESALALAHLISGAITGVLDPSIPIGSVATQSPAAGTLVLVGSPVDIGISFVVPEFDVDATVISQYANSPRILELVEDFWQYFDPAINIQNFYLTVWNIDTAAGFGLDIWGIILGVSRVIPIPGTSGTFGFETADVPPDWENFGDPSVPGAGGPFFSGQVTGNSYKLEDAPYRTLLLTKALANICATTAVALNALITNLFPGRGRCYTLDRGAMQMSYVFEFPLTTIEFAILAYSGVLAHPAGVGFNIVVIDAHYFGFEEAGPPLEPWNFGTFFNG